MGESKRRQEKMGQQYGQEKRIVSWLPITNSQLQLFYKVTNTFAWIGIGAMIVAWLVIRFVGPAFGWWELVG